MKIELAGAIFLIGCGQLSVLAASALVPLRLDWRSRLVDMPALVRQLFWVYGGYTVLSIVALGLVCVLNAEELAQGTRLARSVCVYGLLFWGVRLSLQPFLQAKPFLTTWWLRCGYHFLSVLFATFVAVYAWGALH